MWISSPLSSLRSAICVETTGATSLDSATAVAVSIASLSSVYRPSWARENEELIKNSSGRGPSAARHQTSGISPWGMSSSAAIPCCVSDDRFSTVSVGKCKSGLMTPLQYSLGIVEDYDARSRYLWYGWSITSHTILWDEITFPYPRCLLLVTKSPVVVRHKTKETTWPAYTVDLERTLDMKYATWITFLWLNIGGPFY